jgi:hypothetical protein
MGRRVVSQQTTVSNVRSRETSGVSQMLMFGSGLRQTSMISKTALEAGVLANAKL